MSVGTSDGQLALSMLCISPVNIIAALIFHPWGGGGGSKASLIPSPCVGKSGAFLCQKGTTPKPGINNMHFLGGSIFFGGKLR